MSVEQPESTPDTANASAPSTSAGSLGGLPPLDQFEFMNESVVETPVITPNIDLKRANPFEVMMRSIDKFSNPSWLDGPGAGTGLKAIVLRVEDDGSDPNSSEASGWIGAWNKLKDQFSAMSPPPVLPRVKVYIPKLDSDMPFPETYGNKDNPAADHNLINMFQTAQCADEALAGGGGSTGGQGCPGPGSIVEVQFENLINRTGLRYIKVIQHVAGDEGSSPGAGSNFANQGGVLSAGSAEGADLEGASYTGQGVPAEILVTKDSYVGDNPTLLPPAAGNTYTKICLPPSHRTAREGWPGKGTGAAGIRLYRAVTELKAFVNARLGEGYCDLGHLGSVRDLESTFQPGAPGAPTRVSTSKHAVGLAQDIYFYTKALDDQGVVGEQVVCPLSHVEANKTMQVLAQQRGWGNITPDNYNRIVNDEPLIRAVNDFFELPENGDLVWGGHFGGNNASWGRKSYDWVRMGTAGEMKSIRIDEIHHIEIRDGAEYWTEYMEPLSPYLQAAGIPVPMQQSDLSQVLPAIYSAIREGNMTAMGDFEMPGAVVDDEAVV
mgnify:FL=1|jgi:hypothetical protein